MIHRASIFIFTWALMGANPTLMRADWVTFARGGSVELPTDVRGETVGLIVPWGRAEFPRAAISSIIPADSPADEWRRRRERAEQSPSVADRFGAAWWALEHGLTEESIAMLRASAAAPHAEPHAPLDRVMGMLGLLEQATPEPDTLPVLKLIGTADWNELSGRHVVLLSRASPEVAAERLALLDRVVTTYYLVLAAHGLELPLPPRKLISVLFDRRADYQKALSRIEAEPFSNTQGYYHPELKVVFAFDTRSSSTQAMARRDLGVRRAAANLTPEQRVEIDRQALLLDLQWKTVDLGIAAHETVHQLVAASRLVERFDGWPNWLHEGFSAQFEVIQAGRWVGVGRDNRSRHDDLIASQSPPQLLRLLQDQGLTHGYHRDRYAEAWALVYFLRKEKPGEFMNYLHLLRNPRGDPQEGSTEISFREAFGGNLNRIQAEWRSFLRDQRSPAGGSLVRLRRPGSSAPVATDSPDR